MKRRGALAAAAIALYMLLLAALVWAESFCEQSQIDSFFDALWYSLVTITTVGYGDVYPVSTAGRMIGVFFLLLSVGTLAFVVAAAYRLITGRFLPFLSLYRQRAKRWYLYSQANTASMAMAESCAQEHPQSIQIFCGCADSVRFSGASERRGWHFVPWDAAQMLSHAKRIGADCRVFLISGDELSNADDAQALCAQGASIYCLSDESAKAENVTYFQPHTCCARQYWRDHPLCKGEAQILLVGSGRYAQAMLDSALVTNCFAPLSGAAYHLFGDWSAYRRSHFCLAQAFALNAQGADRDAIWFHDHVWNEDAALIEKADRIIICGDDEDENARIAQELARSYACGAAVFVKTAHQSAPGTRFGGAKAIYSVENVMKEDLDRLARNMHEQYRRSAGRPTPAWEALSPFLKESNRAVADHAMTKVRMLLGENVRWSAESCARAAKRYGALTAQEREIYRRNEHERWLRFYSLHNWRYDPVRNDAMRRHPCLVAYEQLSEEERAKDDYAWMQLEQIAHEAGECV